MIEVVSFPFFRSTLRLPSLFEWVFGIRERVGRLCSRGDQSLFGEGVFGSIVADTFGSEDQIIFLLCFFFGSFGSSLW